MEWINPFGLAFIAVIMIPNILFAIKCKDGFGNSRSNRWIETAEQIGRFGCILFMIVQIPGTWFGWWSEEAFAVYLIADTLLAALYCGIWIVCFRKSSLFRALALSIIPSVLFLFSGIMSRSVPLILSAVLFAPSHIAISCRNARCPDPPAAEPYPVRRLTAEEIPAALSLIWEVFSEYEAPVYSEEGTAEFRRCLRDERYLAGIVYYGAFDAETLIGVAGIRPGQRHICFFFVKGAYHRQGVGTRLFRLLLREYPTGTVTVNSSPYGLPFYRALGFRPTDAEQTVNAIRFTPMAYSVGR